MKTVLIIEDQPSNMEVFCLLFHLEGCQVLEATTGEEARQANKRARAPIDLILCDLTLPDTSGLKVARELVKAQPQAAVLVVSGTPRTGWSNSDIADFAALPQERIDFLEKPFLASALKTKVDLLLGRAASKR